MTIRIANGAGFLGDQLDAPLQLVQAAEVNYLTLEYLAELTLSILAYQRQKDSQRGYARDFLEVLESLAPELRKQPQLRIVTNAGGVNPLSCVTEAARILCRSGLGETRIAVVLGDDLLPRLDELEEQGVSWANMETGETLGDRRERLLSANAYLGAQPIAKALADEARIVITGRVADASLCVGPAAFEFDWKWDDWNTLAGGSVAGHLIECGAQVTGGYSTRWAEPRAGGGSDDSPAEHLARIGFPIAEVDADGRALITKPAGSGGTVDRLSVVRQLIYEIGDPRRYITPDVVVDFTSVNVDAEEAGVRVSGARGGAAPDDYKASLAVRDGYMASGQMLVHGPDCVEKAKCCGEIILRRMELAGCSPARSKIELLGLGESAGRDASTTPAEVILRVAMHDPERSTAERFAKQFAPLITGGPAGLAGYAVGRAAVRPVMSFWPALVPRDLLRENIDVRAADQWIL